MKRWIYSISALLWGCAGSNVSRYEDRFEDKLNARIGQNINDVIEEKGPPTDSYKLPNGKTIYTWEYSYGRHVTGNNFSGYSGVDLSCAVHYSVKNDGRISSWTISGNNCPY